MALKIVFALQQKCPIKGWNDWLYFETAEHANAEKERREKITTKNHYAWRVEETIIDTDQTTFDE